MYTIYGHMSIVLEAKCSIKGTTKIKIILLSPCDAAKIIVTKIPTEVTRFYSV